MRLIQRQSKVRGFTLVEILVVIVIAGILLALSLGLYGRVKGKQIESRLLSEMAVIELALESYKSKEGQYPPSSADWGNYPLKEWGAISGVPSPPNRLYKHLCNNTDNPPFLKDVKVELVQGEILLSTAQGQEGELIKWSYNSYNPKYNKSSYDLWVEYGDYGEDGNPGGGDDIVKVISNWAN